MPDNDIKAPPDEEVWLTAFEDKVGRASEMWSSEVVDVERFEVVKKWEVDRPDTTLSKLVDAEID